MKCGLLMEAAQTHQSLVEAALGTLKLHTETLDSVVREEIRRTLVDELQALTAESNGATQALRALRRAANIRAARRNARNAWVAPLLSAVSACSSSTRVRRISSRTTLSSVSVCSFNVPSAASTRL